MRLARLQSAWLYFDQRGSRTAHAGTPCQSDSSVDDDSSSVHRWLLIPAIPAAHQPSHLRGGSTCCWNNACSRCACTLCFAPAVQQRHRPLQGWPALPPHCDTECDQVPGLRADPEERTHHPAHGRRQGGSQGTHASPVRPAIHTSAISTHSCVRPVLPSVRGRKLVHDLLLHTSLVSLTSAEDGCM
jgi:hypothetical protein